MFDKSALNRRNFLRVCAALPTLACVVDDDTPPLTSFRASGDISVLDPAQGQLLAEPEHCSVAVEFGAWLEVGDQVRIYRTADEYALYTVTELREELDPTIVRMSQAGRARLGTVDPFAGTLDTVITASHLSDAEAQAQSEFVERLLDDGVHTGLLAAAVHGGKIEVNTDRQAERMATLLPGISTWICKGWRRPSGAFTRWHVDSAEVSPNSFPGLATIAGRGFDHVVSFHGMSAAGVLLGGCAPVELRELLRVAIIDAIGDLSIPVVVSGTDGPLSGVAPANFVNWLSNSGHGGIQIEQSLVVRSLYWQAVTDAVASVLGPLL